MRLRASELSVKTFMGKSALIFFFVAVVAAHAQGVKWEASVTSSSPPAFPVPRPMHARYGFGWSGFPGATADINLSKTSGGRLQLDVTGHTIGLVRGLWKFDANHTSIVDATTLHPVEVRQVETARSKKTVTDLSFSPSGVISKETDTPSKNPGPKIRRFDLPHLFDLQSALLYLRSQPLQQGNVQRIVVYPATSAYLATATVLGRERVSVPAGTYNAIKFDLQLSKIGKNHELIPHRKFRRATAWISDDSDRLLLRINAQVFVGAVFVELQSVEFEPGKPQLHPD
jgi:hypothetical protein